MERTIFFLLLTAELLAGCSPKVTVDMLTSEYGPVSTSEVMVLLPTDSVPQPAETIGKVSVTDNGLSVGGNFTQVVGLAVRATANNGGNILRLDEHRNPNAWTSIHRVWGTMMHTDNPTTDSLAYSPSRMQQLQSLALGVKTDETEGGRKRRYAQQQGSVKVSVGPSITTSRIYTTMSGDYQSGLTGIGAGLSITNIGDKSYGWGIDMYGSRTSVSMPYEYSGQSRIKESFTLFHLGPSFVVASRFAEKARFDASLGAGVGVYTSDGQTEAGLGLRASLGIEVMVTERLGIGLDVVRQVSYFRKPEELKRLIKETYGFQQLAFLFGVRFYR